jgi:hypothetical protein
MTKIQIIHDWDYPYIGKKYALKRAFMLIIYVLSRYIPGLRRFCEPIYQEKRQIAEDFLMFEKMMGIKASYCVTAPVRKEFGDFVSHLPNLRSHFHYQNTDRGWVPSIMGKTRWARKDFAHTPMGGVEKSDIDKNSRVLNIHVTPHYGDPMWFYLRSLKKLKELHKRIKFDVF